jgi:signal transduction histidine kinase
MRLRTQLGLFFLVMAGVIGSLGTVTVWGGSQIISIFSASLENMDKVSRVRSLQILLTRQKASLDIYFLIGENQELERFDELGGIVSARLNDLKESYPGDEIITDLGIEYAAVRNAATDVIELYKTDKDRAFAKATDQFLPQVRRFFDRVNEVENRIEQDVQQAHGRVKEFVKQGGRVAVTFALLGGLVGLFFAFSTYRSLSRSLAVLQDGAEAFGRGQWDHRIDLRSHNELGALAHSFNEMATNIKQLELQTVHMHRMSAVGQLAGGVAHEINNPLTGVLGQAQLLLDKMPPDDAKRANIEKIARAAQRCKRIVRSLLDFSRQKETVFASLNLQETVEAALDLCEPDFQHSRVVIVKDFSPAVPPITGNAAQLQQVFINLISNAIHAMPQGGTLTVSSRMADLQQGGRTVEAVEVVFTDTGAGIDSEHISKVFEPFFTTKDIGKGTGLGLSVSLGIVRTHQGDIRVESEGKDRGATFRVFLPVNPDVPAQETPATAVAAEAAGPVRFG